MNNYLHSAARLSPCGTYRYLLERDWDESWPALGFLMLNPSTADGEHDDATIKRCVSQAKFLGFGSLVIANLFALRATDPTELLFHSDPVGPENDEAIQSLVYASSRIICAYGNGPLNGLSNGASQLTDRMENVESYLRSKSVMPWALRLNATGLPAHPVRLPAGLTPVGYRWNEDNDWEYMGG